MAFDDLGAKGLISVRTGLDKGSEPAILPDAHYETTSQ
jgi:hypothetical protein